LKTVFSILLLPALAAAIPKVSAEVIAKEIASPLTGSVSTVYVLQGSPRMKHLGKGTTLAAPRVTSPPFPLGAVSTVIPALETAAIAPPVAVPRFGFGSNYRPDEAPTAPPVIAPLVPVYQKPVYRYVYPGYLRYQAWISYRPYRTFFRGGFCY
jgi:hypothetical protein